MMPISYLFEARAAGKTTQAMIDHFVNRTNIHIDLVIKYLQKIINLNDSRLDNNLLEKEKTHDQSKFKDPEVGPYVFVDHSYHMKDQGKKFDPPADIKKQMQAATFHHIKINKHHPDFWNKDLELSNINNKDRDKPPEKMVDATKMPLTYVASMISDWLAMSEEKGTDPYEWAEQNVNKLWKFGPEQIKLIYDLLDKVWISKIDYKGWIITVSKFDRGWSGNAKKDNETLSIRGWINSREEAIKEFKNMVDNWIRNN